MARLVTERAKCRGLDRAREQMDTPRRRDHNRDVTTLGLKSPLEHKGTCTHAQWHESRSLSSLSPLATATGCGFSSSKG